MDYRKKLERHICPTLSRRMAVVVVHPRDDLQTAKELVAEEIANSILHQVRARRSFSYVSPPRSTSVELARRVL